MEKKTRKIIYIIEALLFVNKVWIFDKIHTELIRISDMYVYIK